MAKVLVVDDEVPIRQWLEFCIGKMDGFRVVGAASNGAEGYSCFKKDIPDIVITDIRMPGMDGLEMLRMMQNINPSVYTIMLTSHEDFDYARRAIRLGASEYILKTEITEESLQELLRKAQEEIEENGKLGGERVEEDMAYRNHYLRSLVLKEQVDTVNESILKEYGIILNKSSYFAMNLYQKEEVERAKIKLLQTEYIESAFLFPVDFENTMIVGSMSRELGNSMQMQMECQRKYGILFLEQCQGVLGVSDIYDAPMKIAEAMRQAYRRARLSFYHTKENYFGCSGKFHIKPSFGEKYKIMFSKELLNQKYAKAVHIKDLMMEEVIKEQPVDIDYVKKLFFYFITSLYHFTRDDVAEMEKDFAVVQDRIKESSNIDELNLVVKEAFDAFGKEGMERYDYSTPVRNAIAYMNEKYALSITLSEVAEHVELSAEYLSRIFKEETGVKFVVYLNNLRLKNALRLLENTNLKVYEVAERVGYSNLSYFSTVFKKNFGQNPFDYKNNSSAKSIHQER